MMENARESGLALKEWSGLVEALLAGEKLVLTRKGGIGEAGFQCPEEPFWLFPTWSHQQEQGLKEAGKAFLLPRAGSENVCLPGWATVRAKWNLDDPAKLASLDPWTLLKPESLEKRFYYRHPGLTVLLVEAWKMPVAHEVVALPEWEGCHSWVRLEKPLSLSGGKFCLNSADCDGMLEALVGILGAAD